MKHTKLPPGTSARTANSASQRILRNAKPSASTLGAKATPSASACAVNNFIENADVVDVTDADGG